MKKLRSLIHLIDELSPYLPLEVETVGFEFSILSDEDMKLCNTDSPLVAVPVLKTVDHKKRMKEAFKAQGIAGVIIYVDQYMDFLYYKDIRLNLTSIFAI